jgi:histidine triad (HIT) family protein
MDDCVFCGIIAGTQPSTMVWEWRDAVAFRPLNPVTNGHTLIVPRQHVRDAVENAAVTVLTMGRAAELAGEFPASNILTSVGAAATQTVFHLHIHLIPRCVGDGLMLPWGTTGDPHELHRCPGMDRLAGEVQRLSATASSGSPVHIGNLVWHGLPPDPGSRYVPVPLEGPMRERRRARPGPLLPDRD